jgi:hypothetical protein
MSKDERQAYRQAGQAVVERLLPDAGDDDRQEIRNKICVLLAGPVAERLADPTAIVRVAKEFRLVFKVCEIRGVTPGGQIGDETYYSAIAGLAKQARALLKRNWPAVQQEAAAIMDGRASVDNKL